MKFKRFLLLALLLGGIVSCSWYETPSNTSPSSIVTSHYSFPHNYLNVEKPYLIMEKFEEKVLVDIDVDKLSLKCENEDSFVLILRSATCGHCENLLENKITPFIEETDSKIYSIEVLSAFNITGNGLQNKEALKKFASLFEGEHYFFYYNEKGEVTGLKGVPVTMVFDSGKMADYLYGYSSTSPIIEMIEAYFII